MAEQNGHEDARTARAPTGTGRDRGDARGSPRYVLSPRGRRGT